IDQVATGGISDRLVDRMANNDVCHPADGVGAEFPANNITACKGRSRSVHCVVVVDSIVAVDDGRVSIARLGYVRPGERGIFRDTVTIGVKGIFLTSLAVKNEAGPSIGIGFVVIGDGSDVHKSGSGLPVWIAGWRSSCSSNKVAPRTSRRILAFRKE